MNPGIFREYDIRGVAGKDFTEADALLIGKAYGTMLSEQGKKHVTVGRDCRVTSEAYCNAFVSGILETGCDVTDIGLCPTPVLYFSIHHLKSDGGAMVTASHNPPEYNGFKLMSGKDSIHGAGLQRIREIIESGRFAGGFQGAKENENDQAEPQVEPDQLSEKRSVGRRSTADVLMPYKAYLEENIHLAKPVRIGVDAGNGTGGITALPVLKALGCEVHDLFCDLDGTFPNHEADPTVKANLEDLIQLVQEKKLDLGVGYDGDADRIGIVDENGEVIYGDQLMVIFAREILSRKPGATFISEVKCSMTMYNDIEKHGGRAIMWKTGHSLIKKKMKEENAALAGEMSGHMFFSDRYLGYDDALYATCRLLEIMVDSKKSVSQLIADLPKTYTTPEIRVECPDAVKFQVVESMVQRFKEKGDVIDIDGMRALFDGGWGLVRASNTQPALVLRFEADSSEQLEAIRKEVESALDEVIMALRY